MIYTEAKVGDIVIDKVNKKFYPVFGIVLKNNSTIVYLHCYGKWQVYNGTFISAYFEFK